MQVSIDQLLLRRHELALMVNALEQVKTLNVYSEVLKRDRVMGTDMDNVVLDIPRLDKDDVVHTFDWYARTLRMVDAIVQRANWATKVSVPAEVMEDYAYDAPIRSKATVEVELAQLLTRRKDLEIKIKGTGQLARTELYERKEARVGVADSIEAMRQGVNKQTVLGALHSYHWYNHQYHECDWAIHKANTGTIVEVDDDLMGEYPSF